jgi:hypothetical protein
LPVQANKRKNALPRAVKTLSKVKYSQIVTIFSNFFNPIQPTAPFKAASPLIKGVCDEEIDVGFGRGRCCQWF